jgi:DNA-binding XRE family transcriptional regulator
MSVFSRTPHQRPRAGFKPHLEVPGGPPPTVDPAKPFAASLRFWRETSGFSIKEAAEQLGVAHSTWSQWERGKRSPSVAYVSLLCQVLHISTCSLFARMPQRCRDCPLAQPPNGEHAGK